MSDATAGPEYGGTADPGLRSSVPQDDAVLGDVVAFVESEHAKLESLLSTMVALAQRGPHQDLEQRWFGVVRELLEFETAEERVVWPEVGDDGPLGEEHERQRRLLERLQGEDELLDRSVDPQSVIDVSKQAVEHLQGERAVLLPALRALPEDQRRRLGEDMRQTMG